ncbi:hypothetical protein IMSAGC019_03139 [Lachnospiraceae bacterium]|nr:hypothetical protein IMSAGC019_03139 [Lachnospiraceae bacterium]
MEMKVMDFIDMAASNEFFKLVVLVIVFDTIFGVLRAVREKKFNSCAGIDGAIRKIGMIVSLVFMLAIDMLVKVNLIGFIPEAARNQLGLNSVGMAEFFALLYIAYEVVSIFKNMALCGLPVKSVWKKVRELLGKYTDELPDTDGLDGNSTTGSVEGYRQQEK